MGAAIYALIAVCTAAFSRLVATRIGQWAVQLMLFFGVQWVATKFVASPVKSGLAAAFAGMPADVLAWVSFLNVDRALTIILSAYAAASLTHMALQRKTV
jgi:hypothetical protein